MDTTYYQTIEQLEKLGVDPEYVQGWVGGYLGNPEREEQRISEAYKAGYHDGRKRLTDAALNWT